MNDSTTMRAGGPGLLEGLGNMFYLVGPSQLETYEELSDVPDFVLHAVPYFALLVALELGVGLVRGVKTYDWKDTLMSMSLGAFQELLGACFGSLLLQVRMLGTLGMCVVHAMCVMFVKASMSHLCPRPHSHSHIFTHTHTRTHTHTHTHRSHTCTCTRSTASWTCRR